MSSYEMEMRLSEGIVGQVASRYPIITDDKLQARVKEAGDQVLSKWVIPLKGYNYRFYAIDGEITNAFASPGGKIFITTGLLDALESPEELQAVLAHEIAHVESATATGSSGRHRRPPLSAVFSRRLQVRLQTVAASLTS